MVHQPTLIFYFGDKNSVLEMLAPAWVWVWPTSVIDPIAQISVFLVPQLWFLV